MARIEDADDRSTAERFADDELPDMMRDLYCMGCGSSHVRILVMPRPGSWGQQRGKVECLECGGKTSFVCEHVDGSPIEAPPAPVPGRDRWMGR